MAKLRLLFRKEDQAVYISHLDLLRTFQRVFPRTGLDIKHSQGFHPHPIISIVLPLSVGQSSRCELMDFEVEQDSDGSGVAVKLNTGMPAGIKVLDCYPAERPIKELAYLCAELTLEYDNGIPADCMNQIAALLAGDELIIQKKTKRKELADIDIAPMLRNFTMHEEGNSVVLTVTVQAQNPGLNPGLLENAIRTHLPGLAPDFVRVCRLSVLDEQGKEFR